MKKLYFLFVLAFGINAYTQNVTIPDTVFKAKLLEASTSNSIAKNAAGQNMKIDTNNDGQIQVSEALAVYQLNIVYSGSGIQFTDLTGIESFTNLTILNCTNHSLTTLDLTNNTNLTEVRVYNNELISLDVSTCLGLTYLWCGMNQLPVLDVSNNVNLENFSCHDNQLTSLDVSNNLNLRSLICGINPISSIDVSNNLLLDTFSCADSLVSEIDISNNWRITDFRCQENPNLTRLNIKNNERYSYWSDLNFSDCPNLEYICCDEANLQLVQQKIDDYGYTCNANTYCSFEPSGYIVYGVAKFDTDNNGCDVSDVQYPNLKFRITTTSDNVLLGTFITTETGNYSITLPSGNYIIKPVLENPDYFNVSPISTNVNFSNNSTGPFEKNFCVTANGIHNDLDIVIVPVNRARPGFDAIYKIIYRNKGNQVANGSLSFDFNDDIMDLISVSPANDGSLTNSLTWNFSNLNPFETREIDLTFNINSPTETPAVNAGNILTYTATISTPTTDETPNDNIFTLYQTVVNSFDPNDKTCLEGDTIVPEMVGEHVHYLIRFENTGTYPAENIVVRDVIDATKFDITTLVALGGSHDYVTRVIGGDKVEFIFENINLPFDDANNDGYIIFKIKTKSTLVIGDTFTNEANIYFDYNFPILTNLAETTIAELSTQDFDYNNDLLTIYPNPVKDFLQIKTNSGTIVKSISVYNSLGQIMMTKIGDNKLIDLSSLKSGMYFMKISTDNGVIGSKFLKK